MPNLTVRRSARATALTGIAVIIFTATTVAFFESFDGLYRFAAGHGLSGFGLPSGPCRWTRSF